MRKILSTLCMALFALSISATTANDFAFDEQKVENAMETLNELEVYVQTTGITFDKMEKEERVLFAGIAAASYSASFSIDDMDWGAFAWGFCCWPIGFFVVAINSRKDSYQKMSFWIGLGVSVILSAVSNVIYFATYY